MGGEGVDDLLSAVQQGHVTMVRRAPAASGAKAGGGASGRTGIAREDFLQATAERAAYDGDLDRVTLTGGVQVSDAGSVLWANQVALDRATGDAQAAGAVKVNYLAQASGNQRSGLRGTAPGARSDSTAHRLSRRMWLLRAGGHGACDGRCDVLRQAGEAVAGRIAGAGPGDSSMRRAERDGYRSWWRRRCDGRAGAHDPWSTAQLQAGPDKRGKRSPARRSRRREFRSAKSGSREARSREGLSGWRSVVRIASGELVYSGDLRQAEFTGGVRAETVDGTIRAHRRRSTCSRLRGRRSLPGRNRQPPRRREMRSHRLQGVWSAWRRPGRF